MGACYEVDIECTDSESFRFDVILVDASGAPVDLAGKTHEYILWGCGEILRLNDANGLTVDAGSGRVAIAPAPERRLRAGNYQHGFRSTDTDAVTVQHFDGEVSVSKGGF